MKFYVTRHGEAVWNVYNKICGRTDVELTEKGREQARQLAQRAGEYQIDLILCSPLQRAHETAQTVAIAGGFLSWWMRGSSSRITVYLREKTGRTRVFSPTSASLLSDTRRAVSP